VRLDRLRTEEERFGNLRIRPTVDHKPRDLELALGQSFDAVPSILPGRVRRWMRWPRARSSRSAAPRYLSAPQARSLEAACFSLSHRAHGLPGLGACAARERPCERLDRRTDLVRGGGEGALDGEVGVAGIDLARVSRAERGGPGSRHLLEEGS
jgi:hypothetical protein